MGDMTPNFSRHEFKCKCGCGRDNIDPRLVFMLQQLRDRYGKSLTPSSGCRCPKHNEVVGGGDNSSHITTETRQGQAADFEIKDPLVRGHLVQIALDVGFRRIGLGADCLHLDCDASKYVRDSAGNPKPMIWIY